MTMVNAASTELELVCMKSLDTKGCSSKLMMPFIGPSAAALIAAFTSSFEVFLLTLRTKSTTDTLGVGTRKAMPLNLPLNCGSTSATALAAPVLVGTMLQAPARARRKSRWRPSRIIWSPVYEWVVVMSPYSTPKFSSRTLQTEDIPLVVQEAFETTVSASGL